VTARRRGGRLLLDEMFSNHIAALLGERGVDCRAVCADPDLVARDDRTVLDAATAEDRVLVTNNVADFEHLRRARRAQGDPVANLIYTSDAAFPRDRAFTVGLVDALEHAAEEHLAEEGGGVHWLQPKAPS
jgi:predicted nuclease of predicted toxin-antitoxin system